MEIHAEAPCLHGGLALEAEFEVDAPDISSAVADAFADVAGQAEFAGILLEDLYTSDQEVPAEDDTAADYLEISRPGTMNPPFLDLSGPTFVP